MIVLVTGGRTFGRFHERAELRQALDSLLARSSEGLIVVHGCARGADFIARQWAREQIAAGRPVQEQGFRADWDHYGTRAGPVRNRVMVEWVADRRDLHDEVLVLACPGGKGTADCIRRAESLELDVRTLEQVVAPLRTEGGRRG